MSSAHQVGVVTADDWEKTGYRDGLHGNDKFPPSRGLGGGNYAESVAAYLHGYGRGEAEAAVSRLGRFGGNR